MCCINAQITVLRHYAYQLQCTVMTIQKRKKFTTHLSKVQTDYYVGNNKEVIEAVISDTVRCGEERLCSSDVAWVRNWDEEGSVKFSLGEKGEKKRWETERHKHLIVHVTCLQAQLSNREKSSMNL